MDPFISMYNNVLKPQNTFHLPHLPSLITMSYTTVSPLWWNLNDVSSCNILPSASMVLPTPSTLPLKLCVETNCEHLLIWINTMFACWIVSPYIIIIMNIEQWTMNDEPWTIEYEHWTLNIEQWTLKDEQWTLNIKL